MDNDYSVVSLTDNENKQEDADVVSLTDVVLENATDNQDQSLFMNPVRLSKS